MTVCLIGFIVVLLVLGIVMLYECDWQDKGNKVTCWFLTFAIVMIIAKLVGIIIRIN